MQLQSPRMWPSSWAGTTRICPPLYSNLQHHFLFFPADDFFSHFPLRRSQMRPTCSSHMKPRSVVTRSTSSPGALTDDHTLPSRSAFPALCRSPSSLLPLSCFWRHPFLRLFYIIPTSRKHVFKSFPSQNRVKVTGDFALCLSVTLGLIRRSSNPLQFPSGCCTHLISTCDTT